MYVYIYIYVYIYLCISIYINMHTYKREGGRRPMPRTRPCACALLLNKNSRRAFAGLAYGVASKQHAPLQYNYTRPSSKVCVGGIALYLNARLGRLGPYLKSGTVCVWDMNGLRKGMNAT